MGQQISDRHNLSRYFEITKPGYVSYNSYITLLDVSAKTITLQTSPKFSLSTNGKVNKYLDADNPKNLGLVLPL